MSLPMSVLLGLRQGIEGNSHNHVTPLHERALIAMSGRISGTERGVSIWAM